MPRIEEALVDTKEVVRMATEHDGKHVLLCLSNPRAHRECSSYKRFCEWLLEEGFTVHTRLTMEDDRLVFTCEGDAVVTVDYSDVFAIMEPVDSHSQMITMFFIVLNDRKPL